MNNIVRTLMRNYLISLRDNPDILRDMIAKEQEVRRNAELSDNIEDRETLLNVLRHECPAFDDAPGFVEEAIDFVHHHIAETISTSELRHYEGPHKGGIEFMSVCGYHRHILVSRKWTDVTDAPSVARHSACDICRWDTEKHRINYRAEDLLKSGMINRYY